MMKMRHWNPLLYIYIYIPKKALQDESMLTRPKNLCPMAMNWGSVRIITSDSQKIYIERLKCKIHNI